MRRMHREEQADIVLASSMVESLAERLRTIELCVLLGSVFTHQQSVGMDIAPIAFWLWLRLCLFLPRSQVMATGLHDFVIERWYRLLTP